MKNSWFVLIFIVGVVVTVLFAFNYQGGKETIPLSEIFPDEETSAIDVDYEFVTDEQLKVKAEVPSEVKILNKKVQPITQIKEDAVQVKSQQKDTIDLNKIPFTIQVASFKERKAAESTLATIKAKNYNAYIVTRNLREKGTWHRIYIGRYDTKEEAEENLLQVKADYKNSFIISPK